MKKAGIIAGVVFFILAALFCLAAFGWKLTLVVGFFAFLELMNQITKSGNDNDNQNPKGGVQ